MDKARKEKLKRLEEIRLRRQRELEEEARRRDAERAAALAAARTPAVSSAADSYDLSGLVSDASSDEEDNPRAQVPRWAQVGYDSTFSSSHTHTHTHTHTYTYTHIL